LPDKQIKKPIRIRPLFSGSYEHSIDAKGRLSIPSKFRETLIKKYDSRNITLIIQDGCLLAYPEAVWSKMMQQCEALNPFDKQVLNFQRSFFSMAHELEVDSQGRVLIPPNLRNQAGLDKEVLIVGSANKFEIWDKGRWEEFSRSPQGDGWALASQVFKAPQA
jgi:MraZ protein